MVGRRVGGGGGGSLSQPTEGRSGPQRGAPPPSLLLSLPMSLLYTPSVDKAAAWRAARAAVA